LDAESDRRQFPIPLVMCELIVVVAIPLVLNLVSDDLKWLNAQTWYSARLVILVLSTLFVLHIAYLANVARMKRFRNLTLVIALLIVPFIAITILRPPRVLQGRVGQWLHDDFIGVQVPQGTSGNLLAEENYDLQLTLENRTGMPLEITEVEVKKYNRDAAQVLGRNGDGPIHVSTYNVIEYIKPNDRVSISIPGNEVLPKTAAISIYHTLSGEPSKFEVDLGARVLPMPQPRQLAKNTIYTGTDALHFITRAAQGARDWGGQVSLVAAFPGESNTYIDPSSRLKYIEVRNWIVTFYSPKLGRLYTEIVRENKIEGHESERSASDPALPEEPMNLPVIGNQQALEIANARNLLSADWKDGPRLEAIQVDGSWKLGWSLPYRGIDALPVVIDATTGDLLKMHGSGFIATGASTSLSREPEAQRPEVASGGDNATSESSAEPPRIVAWLSADEDSGMNGFYPIYDCNPFIIGNPPGGLAIEFDLIKIKFAHGSPDPADPSASIIYFAYDNSTPELGSGVKKIMRNFYGDNPVSLETAQKREVVAIEPDRQIELEHIRLMASTGQIQVSLFKGDREILTSDLIGLPEWKSLPSTVRLYLKEKEASSARRGVALSIPLHSP